MPKWFDIDQEGHTRGLEVNVSIGTVVAVAVSVIIVVAGVAAAIAAEVRLPHAVQPRSNREQDCRTTGPGAG